MNKFFISHYNGDRDIADVISEMLRRITLNQIQTWFSSDSAEMGGFTPGDIWFNKILDRISQSKAVVIIITPNSVNRPWIYYESGMAQTLENCEVIPICVGIKPDTLPAPLNMYQCYQILDYRSLKEFTSKLVSKFQIHFDEEMAKPLLEKAVDEISRKNFEVKSIQENLDIEEILSELKIHIDNRFLSLFNGRDHSLDKNNSVRKGTLSYYITLVIEMPDGIREHFIEIREDDTFQDITNQIFFLLESKVAAYKYLDEWIIIEQETSKRLIIREIAYRIPATYIFDPNFKYIVKLIKTPYLGSDSNARVDE